MESELVFPEFDNDYDESEDFIKQIDDCPQKIIEKEIPKAKFQKKYPSYVNTSIDFIKKYYIYLIIPLIIILFMYYYKPKCIMKKKKLIYKKLILYSIIISIIIEISLYYYNLKN
jgi:hypothetical protein